MEKLLILGIGNPYVSDDGIGIHITRILRELINDTRIEFKEFYHNGFDALGLLKEYEYAIVIDAAKTGNVEVGKFQIFSHKDVSPSTHMYSLHTFGFLSALQLAEVLSIKLPSQITVFAIEVANTEVFGKAFTPEVETAVPTIIEGIIQHIRKIIPDVSVSDKNMYCYQNQTIT